MNRRSRRLQIEPLEARLLLAADDLAEVPILDGEWNDPTNPEANYLGGATAAEYRAAFDYTDAVFHAGRGGYELAIDGALGAGEFAFAQSTFGATGLGDPYLDTRDLTHYEQIAFWFRNATGSALSLELGIKDFTDSDTAQARWIQPVAAVDQWIEVRAPLDLAPQWVGPAQAGWAIDGTPDLARAHSFSFTIVANQGESISGSVYLDDVRLIEPGGPVDPASADIQTMVERLARRQFDALWGMRDRSTGLLPAISAYQDVMATNATAAMVKSLPGAIERGWVDRGEVDAYVATLVGTLNLIMDKANYLPTRYVDRVSLEANYQREESSVDAAMLYLAMYQYGAQYGTSAALSSSIDSLLARFDFASFATSDGWQMAFDLDTDQFVPYRYDGYSGEIGLISLAADLAGQVDMAALYHSGMLRDAFVSEDGESSYLMHSDSAHRSPLLQWLFPLFVDVASRGPDNYPDPALASNPLDNAIAYQQDVLARLAAAGRESYLQPDAGNDWEGLPANYHQYSVFEDFGKPALFMPWSMSFSFLADPTAADAGLRQLLQAELHGPFGLVDSAYWDDGSGGPRDVAARTDFWNTGLSLLAFQQYLYHENQRLSNLPDVRDALDKVFTAPRGGGPAVEFLIESADYYCTSRIDADDAGFVVPLYSEYLAGGDYTNINDAVRMTLDDNDGNAATGRTGFRASWDGSGVNGYFQFGFSTLGPRDLAEFGFVHELRFFAQGDTEGQQVAVNLFGVSQGGGWQKLFTDPATITLSTQYQPFVIDIPEGIHPADLHAVQFVLGDGRPAGGGTFWLDAVRLASDGCDPARLIQSFRADVNSQAERDLNIYPNRSYLYDNALTIMALWGTGDLYSRSVARDIADAAAATVLPDGSYYNQRNSGHVFNNDGSIRPAYGAAQTLGDNAWFGLALMDLYDGTGESTYLDRVRAISDWAETNLKDSGALGGYRGGYDAAGGAFAWRSTEHNIDLFALNRRLADALAAAGDPAADLYAGRATHAGDFVMQMFDSVDGKFWAGTLGDGTLNTGSVPLDAQLWAVMALGSSDQYAAAIDWARPLTWAEANLYTSDGPYTGFTYSSQTTPNRVWWEGTAQAAATYAVQQSWSDFTATLQAVEFARRNHPQGDGRGVVAASSDETADPAFDAVYDARLHAGATAWLVLAEQRRNPFLSQTAADTSPPVATLNNPGVTVVGDASYQPGLDPLPGINLISWWNFESDGASRWEAAVQDAYDAGFRAVNLVPVRYVELSSGAIVGGQKSPDLTHVVAGMVKAKSLGMIVTVNPMVEALGFSPKRTDIELDGAVADRFFLDYGDYLFAVATAAQVHGADRMTVGSELKGLTAGHAGKWAAVIERTASAFQGPLGYAANWDEYANANLTAAIWENPHIDFIGIDLYPPLATTGQADASGGFPDEAFIDVVQQNYQQALGQIREFAANRKDGRGMPVVLTEVGAIPYNLTATQPSSDSFDVQDPDEQTNVYEALLRVTDEAASWLPEWYAWHWDMDGAEGSKFLLHPSDPLSQSAAKLLINHVNWDGNDYGWHDFTVKYTDNVAVDSHSLDGGDIRVVAPDGTRLPATLVQAAQTANDSPQWATYRVAAPAGAWAASDYGVYQIVLQPDQVFDTDGLPVRAGSIGSFRVDLTPWQFRENRFDVNNDGLAVPLDVLTLINDINSKGNHRLILLPEAGVAPPPYFDVNGDNWLTPSDVLALINDINARLAAGEGEPVDTFWCHYTGEVSHFRP